MDTDTFSDRLIASRGKSEPSFVEFIKKQQSLMLSHYPSKSSWWVEINTSVPLCTYYFGPFDSKQEAQNSRSGYVNDLLQEEARDIIALVKQCQPPSLTVDQGYVSINP